VNPDPREPSATSLRVAADTGGTFTDLCILDREGLRFHKVPSSPAAPEQAVLAGLEGLEATGKKGRLLHGSTVGLNAILTGRGAKVALITNEGFEDLCEIGRQERTALYDLRVPPRPTLVPRSLRFGVRERRLASGERASRATRAELRELAARLRKRRVEALAICLLHSYAHPEDEERLAEALRGLRIPTTLSAGLLRRHREYERFSTAILNAFVHPVLDRYWRRLAREAAPLSLHLVRNEGGSLPVESALETPLRSVLSGPAGGAAGAAFWAEAAGFERAVGFDMGGTSADVTACGKAHEVADVAFLGPFAMALPTIPLHSVGCGGGSIAWFDEDGSLRVGPRSAGADPGPACYGRGTEPTVTDAHLVLGRLPPWGLLGGSFPLDLDRALDAVGRIAAVLGCDVRNAAEGILEVADACMARPLRSFTLGQGMDPERVCLVAFGGAGGLHAARLADRIGFRNILVPPGAGVLSALGMLAMPPVFEFETALFLELDRTNLSVLAGAARDFGRKVLAANGSRFRDPRVEVAASLRYRGMLAELWVPAGRSAREHFERTFESRFGFLQELPVECLRLRARLSFESRRTLGIRRRLRNPRAFPRTSIPCTVPARLGPRGLPCIHRSEMHPRETRQGPLAILEDSSTTILEKGWTCRLRDDGCLHLTREEQAEA